MINIPKGTKDCLPNESYKWQYIEGVMRSVATNYGIKEIRTPIFEHTELFLRGVGDTTDIVNKEMYTFLDKGNRSITLKPEGTAGVVRSFIENGMASSVMPLKTYYITPCFRYERPQNGRLREFHQFGIEYFGSKTAYTDAEVILVAKEILNRLNVTQLQLYINSIGCKECRKNYISALKEYLKSNYNLLCPLCQERFEKNPLRILDCKNESCKVICDNAPKITDYLCEDCSNHFETTKKCLEEAGVEYKINPFIVRGLDYYTKTVFEFVSTAIGSQGTVCGGGRYDNLVEELGGNSVPAVGFAIGVERLIILLESLGIQTIEPSVPDIFIGSMGENEGIEAFKIAQNLRTKKLNVESELLGRSVKAQLKYANKINAKFVIIIGANEIESQIVSVKNMSNGEAEQVKIDALYDYLIKNL